MKIREARENDLAAWLKLRRSLWPEYEAVALLHEAKDILASPDEVCYLLIIPPDRAEGFVEGAVHPGPIGPYAHIEGWYVTPEFRGKGYGRELVGVLEQWCLHRAIYRLTSDTTPDYPLSLKAHAQSGFKKIREFTIFVKEL